VRKTVTVLFADVTGSTALGEQLDPESLRHVMARYFDVARTSLERHGGTVEKFIGDAVMAVFGVPTVHEDDALRALRAAADLREALAALNEELGDDYGVSLEVRVGANTGEVVTGTEERLATGDAVNVAARLEQAARPGEILVGERTYGLARGAVEAEAVEPLALKGKSNPVQAFRLVRVVEGAPAFERRLDSRLVGRGNELGRLQAAFEEAVSARECRLVTLLGPPGIGKSRLARELAAKLIDDATVLVGRCLPYGEGITYWPLIEIFRELGAEEELTAALAAGASEEAFWSIRKTLEEHARDRPVALIVDDVHWAEPTLLDLLEHVVDWTRDAPLLVVCLARADFVDVRPAWGGRQRMEWVALEPLTSAESNELIDELVDRSGVAVDARERVRHVAAGNPLFVEQLLAMLAEGGDPEQVPPTIQALLAARLDSLPDAEREVLERASVVGLEFEWEALGELAADQRRPSGAQLSALVRKELVMPHEAIEDSFRFKHMLIRDAAYERIPKALRAELHERFADWLDGRDEEFDEVIGYHLEQAHDCLVGLGRTGERARVLAERAADRLAASGRRADARGDTQATVNLLERAARLLPDDDRRRLDFLATLGRALRDGGDMDRAEAVLAEAVRLAEAAGERVVVADGNVSLFELRFHRVAESGVERDDVLRELGASIRVFEEVGDEAGLARALVLAGKLRFWAGEAAASLEDLERAARNARDAGDRAHEAEGLQYVAAAMRIGPAPVDDALRRCDEISRTVANRKVEAAVLSTRANLEAMGGRFEAARHTVGQAIELASDIGVTGLLDTHVRPAAGSIELLAGDLVAAERLLRLSCERTEEIGELGFLSSITPDLIDALHRQERYGEALELTERWRPERLTVPEDVDAQAGWRRVRAKALARTGEVEEAERVGRDAVAIASKTDYLTLRARAHADLGEVLSIAGRWDDATASLREAVALHEAKGNVVEARLSRDLLAEPHIEV
jgi:class 3 adenylate cyclase/tetratricopeptide (TPR) repeat protein